MPADRSRRTDGLRDSYVGVVAQQGRVTLDRDFNAEHGYLAGRVAAGALDIIGPAGTPDDGFRISLPAAGDPPLWTPPAPLPAPSDHPFDFRIGPGIMYVGGQRAVLEGEEDGHPVVYGYFDQPDWADLPDFAGPAGDGAQRELVYLLLSEQEVSAVEDPDLLEVALGGPDTTQRLRMMRRVVRENVAASDCAGAWDAATATWLTSDGLRLDPATMRLRPEARLIVSFADQGATTDPCDPIVVGGYLGAENQTIRVQIADAGGAGAEAQLLWGYDNASFLYRATPLPSNPAVLTIAPSPPDNFHLPQTGQVVEILRTAAVIATEPDVTDPTGQATIVRCVAEATGVIRRLTQPFGPSGAGDPTPHIVLDQPLPAEFLADKTPLFMRVWQSEIAFDPTGATVLLTDDVTGASTGVQVTISTPAGEALTAGAYWLIAVRPSTPQGVYPERLLTAPQPPDGPALWACPLAVIAWTDSKTATITDCRNTFGGVGGQQGCCTVTVTPRGKLGLQQAIDRAAAAGGGTVCLRSGTYDLPAPLQFTSKDAGVTLEACGGDARLVVAEGKEDAFAQGLVVIAGAPRVTLRGLTIEPAPAPRPPSVAATLRDSLRGGRFTAGALAAAGDAIRVMLGVHIAESPSVTVEDCTVEFADVERAGRFNIVGAGIFLQGDCQGVRILGCAFVSENTPTSNRSAAAPGGLATSSPARPANADRTGIAGETNRVLEMVRTGFEAVVANTVAVDAAAPPAPLVALVGCLAVPNSGSDLGAVCNLGDALIRENSFVGMTLAIFGFARLDTLRIEDNDARNCLGGYWLILSDWSQPTDPKTQSLFNGEFAAAFGFTELFLLVAVGMTIPLPVAISKIPPTGPAALFAIGNQTEPAPVTVSGTAAMLILANRTAVEGADTSASLIVADNRLRSRSGPSAPTALIATGREERCAISGNLFLSENSRGADPGPSLWLAPDNVSDGVTLLSVVGNVIQGRTDLNQLPRAGVTPAQTWALYNAMPS